MALSIVLEGEPDKAVRTIGGAVITVGRVDGNDIVLSDARISSRHGRLIRRGEGYAYEDLDSRNGSLIERDGERTVVQAHQPLPIQSGDRLLLGDLDAPVALLIRQAPESLGDFDGGTVIARHSVLDSGIDFAGGDDNASMKSLFGLLRDLSGSVEPDVVHRRIADAVVERFPQTSTVLILLRDSGGEWVPEFTHAVGSGQGEVLPSRTLTSRAVQSREVVSYLPGAEAAPESVVGLAGSVVVPLLAGEEAIGVLYVESKSRAFAPTGLPWFSVVGTHVAANLVGARRFRTLARSEAELRAENLSLKSTAYMPRPIVGESRPLLQSLKQLERVGRTDTTVLVLGETGTGKELAARYVHAHSGRAEQDFAAINCGALAEELLNSELFGHKRGSFTGADRDRKGLFESAAGGTVFLDEIGEVSPAVQVRLLRVLQEKEVQPVGTHVPIKVDVRIVAATNRDLQAEVSAGSFREDLYYRLAVFPVKLPPLRERGTDIEILAERFRESACGRHDVWVGGFTEEAMRALKSYAWPGNIRQLEHEIERAVILSDSGALVGLDELSDALVGDRPGPESEAELPQGKLKEVMALLEERVIRRSLEEHGDNRTRAAETLGISRQALQVKLARWRDRNDSNG